MRRCSRTTGRLALILSLIGASTGAVDTAAGGDCFDPVYVERFDGDAGSFVLVNGADPGAGWAFDDSCPAAATSPGAPGTLRWGSFSDCDALGSEAHVDSALAAPLALPSGCFLRFDYRIGVDDPGSASAELRTCVDGEPCVTLLSLADGDLIDDGSWHAATVEIPPVTQLEFVGSTDGGTGNAGAGWSIDNVVVECPIADCFVPAVDARHAVLFVAAMSLALVAMLLRRRWTGPHT